MSEPSKRNKRLLSQIEDVMPKTSSVKKSRSLSIHEVQCEKNIVKSNITSKLVSENKSEETEDYILPSEAQKFADMQKNMKAKIKDLNDKIESHQKKLNSQKIELLHRESEINALKGKVLDLKKAMNEQNKFEEGKYKIT